MIKLISSAALGLSVMGFLALAAAPAAANGLHSKSGVTIVVKDFGGHGFKQRGFHQDRFDRFDRRSRFGSRVRPNDFARGRFHGRNFDRFDRRSRFGGHRSNGLRKFIFVRR